MEAEVCTGANAATCGFFLAASADEAERAKAAMAMNDKNLAIISSLKNSESDQISLTIDRVCELSHTLQKTLGRGFLPLFIRMHPGLRCDLARLGELDHVHRVVTASSCSTFPRGAIGGIMGIPIRLIKHEAVPKCGSYEVRFLDGRASRCFYWDDIPGRRLRPDLVDSPTAEENAKAFARERGQMSLKMWAYLVALVVILAPIVIIPIHRAHDIYHLRYSEVLYNLVVNHQFTPK